jgi:hypothetical protein
MPSKLLLFAAAAACWIVLSNWNEISTGIETAMSRVEVKDSSRHGEQGGGETPEFPRALDTSVVPIEDATHSEPSVRLQPDLELQQSARQSTSTDYSQTNAGLNTNSQMPQVAADVELSASAVAKWRQVVWADCHGQGITDCERLINTFTRVLQAPEYVDDGWSDWMETQIRDSLSAKASESQATRVNVKCTAEGCVFVLYANSAKEMFDRGWRHANDFDRWLRQAPWNQWLEVHSRQSSKQSTLAWRVVGSPSAKPFINWYVVTRRQ